MNRRLDPLAIPALMAIVLLILCATVWLWRGFPITAGLWLMAAGGTYFLHKWGFE